MTTFHSEAPDDKGELEQMLEELMGRVTDALPPINDDTPLYVMLWLSTRDSLASVTAYNVDPAGLAARLRLLADELDAGRCYPLTDTLKVQ